MDLDAKHNRAIRNEMRHVDELDEALDADPASMRNALRRLDSEPKTNG